MYIILSKANLIVCKYLFRRVSQRMPIAVIFWCGEIILLLSKHFQYSKTKHLILPRTETRWCASWRKSGCGNKCVGRAENTIGFLSLLLFNWVVGTLSANCRMQVPLEDDEWRFYARTPLCDLHFHWEKKKRHLEMILVFKPQVYLSKLMIVWSYWFAWNCSHLCFWNCSKFIYQCVFEVSPPLLRA